MTGRPGVARDERGADGGPLGRVDRVMAAVSGAMAVLAAVVIVVMMLWILASVLGRVVGFTVVGTPEIASNGVVAVSLLCVPYVMRHGGHIRTGIVVDRLPAGARRIAWLVACLLGAVLFAVVAVSAFGPMLTSWADGEYSGEGSMRVPTGPLRTIVVLFAVCMVVECLLAAGRGPRAAAADDGPATPDDEPGIHDGGPPAAGVGTALPVRRKDV